jgi:lipoprotein-releasing system permease protein
MYAKYILKEIIKRKSRSTTIVLTVAIITAMLLLFSGAMNAYSSGIYSPFKSIGSDLILQKTSNAENTANEKIRMPFGKGLFDNKEIESLSALNHVKNLSKTLVVWNFGKNGFTTIEGIEPESAFGQKLGSWIKEGNFLTKNGAGKAVLESHYANFNHFKTGSKITLGNETFTVIGIIGVKEESQVFSSNVYVSLADAQKISGINGYNQVYLKADSLANEKTIKNEIKQINTQITAISKESISASLGNIVEIYNKFYYIGAGIVVLILGLILFKVNTINLLERRKDIAVMQSIGWTKKDITKQIISELFLQTITGFALGLASTFIIILLIGPMSIQTNGLGLNKATISMPITIPLTLITAYFALIIAVSFTVSFLLTKKIAKARPSDNLRSL